MPFVQLGAPGIVALRSPDEAKRRVLARAEAREDSRLDCDGWNHHFGEITGVWGPDVRNGCYDGDNRSQLVTFKRWFSWLRHQR